MKQQRHFFIYTYGIQLLRDSDYMSFKFYLDFMYIIPSIQKICDYNNNSSAPFTDINIVHFDSSARYSSSGSPLSSIYENSRELKMFLSVNARVKQILKKCSLNIYETISNRYVNEIIKPLDIMTREDLEMLGNKYPNEHLIITTDSSIYSIINKKNLHIIYESSYDLYKKIDYEKILSFYPIFWNKDILYTSNELFKVIAKMVGIQYENMTPTNIIIDELFRIMADVIWFDNWKGKNEAEYEIYYRILKDKVEKSFIMCINEYVSKNINSSTLFTKLIASQDKIYSKDKILDLFAMLRQYGFNFTNPQIYNFAELYETYQKKISQISQFKNYRNSQLLNENITKNNDINENLSGGSYKKKFNKYYLKMKNNFYSGTILNDTIYFL